MIVVDLLDADDCRRAVDECALSFGGLDILVSNASSNVDAHPADLEVVTDEQLMERVNGKGMGSVRVTRAALPYLRASGHGRVILLGGTSARGGGRPRRGVCQRPRQCLRREFREAPQRRRRVGWHHCECDPSRSDEDGSPRTANRGARGARLGVSFGEAEAARAEEVPIGRMVEPADVAAVAVFLASPLCGAVTGQAIAVDGGATPGVVY